MVQKETIWQCLKVALAACITVALGAASVQPVWSKVLTHHDSGFITDSIISIIANPERYDGKNVRVHGYLHLEFEDFALYLSKDDADYLRTENSLGISFSDNEVDFEPLDRSSFSVSNAGRKFNEDANLHQRIGRFNCVNVMLEGTYDAETHEIRNVRTVQEDIKWYEGKISLSSDFRMKENAKAIDEVVSKTFHPILLALAILAFIASCLMFLRQLMVGKELR